MGIPKPTDCPICVELKYVKRCLEMLINLAVIRTLNSETSSSVDVIVQVDVLWQLWRKNLILTVACHKTIVF